jgi:hypothetical protein
MVHKRQVSRSANISFWSKTSSGASHQYSLFFLFDHYLYVKIACALSLRN